MVGLLCSRGKERRFANYLRKIMMPLLKERQIYLFVFSLPNINLVNKTVYGSLISKETVVTLKADIPSVVFNFAVQHKKSDVRKLRELMEVENLDLINPANSFNQWSIMEMLTSDDKTKRYILPYVNISKENINFDFAKAGNFIVKPQNGSSLSDIIYGSKTSSGFDLYNLGGIIYSHLFDVQSAITPTIRTGKWILLTSPELITYKNKLLIIRSYLQKNNDGLWKVVLKTDVSQAEKIYKNSDKKIETSLLKIMSYINCFIPDLHFCTIDFVLSKDGTPYFVNLGGWQYLIPGKTRHKILFDALCQNIMARAEIFLSK